MNDNRVFHPDFPSDHPLIGSLQRIYDAYAIAQRLGSRRLGRATSQDRQLILRLHDIARHHYRQFAELSDDLHLWFNRGSFSLDADSSIRPDKQPVPKRPKP